MATVLKLAVRNLSRNRRRTLITLAALLVGVSVTVTVRGLLNGLQGSMRQAAAEGTTGALQVHRRGYMKNVLSTPLQLDFEVTPKLLAQVRAVDGVREVAPRIFFPGTASAGDEAVITFGLAIDPSLEPKVCPRRASGYVPGAQMTRADHVLLDASLAQTLGAKPGAEIVFLAPDRDGVLNGELGSLGGMTQPQVPGMPKSAVVPLPLAQRLLRMEGRATELAVAVDDLDQAQAVAGRLRAALGPEYEVHTWDEIASYMRQAMDRQEKLLSAIASAFMLLMLLGVANTQLMGALERTREIGTMLALGVTRGFILRLFLAEALVLGGLGGLLGGALGAAVTAYLHTRGIEFEVPLGVLPFELRPVVPPGYLAQVFVLAALGAAIFGLYPAWRASRLRPVQALAGQT